MVQEDSMKEDFHVRFRENAEVKLLCMTRL